MTRVVDKVFRGSTAATAGVAGSAVVANSAPLPFSISDELSCAVLVNKKIAQETFWNAYPSTGLGKLVLGTVGFNMQWSGGAGVSKGCPHFRVDADSVQYTNNPTAQGGVMRGNHIGWNLYVCTVNRSRSRIYINGRPESERAYTHGTGIDAGALVTLTARGNYGSGYTGCIHSSSVCEFGLWDVELTPEEVHDYWFAGILPHRGGRCYYSLSNILAASTAPNGRLDASMYLAAFADGVRSMEVP